MTTAASQVISSVEVSHVIVRACVACGHAREIGQPCAGCGLTEPPVTHDLGVQSTYYKNPLKRVWWQLTGAKQAARRTEAVNEDTKGTPE